RGARQALLGEDLLLGLAQQVVAVAAGAPPGGGGGKPAPPPPPPPPARPRARPPPPPPKKPRPVGAGGGPPRPPPRGAPPPRRGVGGRGGEAQQGVGARAAEQLVDRAQLVHRRLQPGPVELAELARVARGERPRPGERVLQAPLDPVLALAPHQRLDVPGARL